MICPKCGFEQPDGPECMRCGIIVSRYKGPVVAAGPRAAPPTFAPGPLPTPPSIPPPPASGTVFGDSPSAGTATVYSGPPPGSVAPTFSSLPSGPAFHGTFETGNILGEAFSVYFANIIPFLLLSALALSPLLLYSAWASSLPAADPTAKLIQSFSTLIQALCTPIATAAITYGVYQQMRGSSPSVITCLKVGLSSLLPLLGLAFVQGCGVGLGLLACVVPGILLVVRWAVAIPAKVEERVGISDALGRSTHLTEGYRWQVFGVLGVLAVLGFALNIILLLAVGGRAQSGPFLVLGSLVHVVTTGLSAAASAVMYYRLRSVKESIDVDQLSSVFA